MKLSLPILTLTGGIFIASMIDSKADVTITPVSETNQWDITFDPITFTANGEDGKFAWLVFEDFYTNSSNSRGVFVGGTIELTIDGETTSYTPNNANGTFDGTLGAIDQNDLFINIAASGPDPIEGTQVIVSSSGIRFCSDDVPAIAEGPFDTAFWDNANERLIQADVVSVANAAPTSVTRPKVINFSASQITGWISMKWSSVAEVTYAIDYSDDLVAWQELSDSEVASGQETTYTGPGIESVEQPGEQPRRYYRVRVVE